MLYFIIITAVRLLATYVLSLMVMSSITKLFPSNMLLINGIVNNEFFLLIIFGLFNLILLLVTVSNKISKAHDLKKRIKILSKHLHISKEEADKLGMSYEDYAYQKLKGLL